MERVFGENSEYSEETQNELKQVILVTEQERTDISVYGKTGMGRADGIVVDAWFTGFRNDIGDWKLPVTNIIMNHFYKIPLSCGHLKIFQCLVKKIIKGFHNTKQPYCLCQKPFPVSDHIITDRIFQIPAFKF